MFGRLCLMGLLATAPCRTEIIDRVAVAVGNRVITASDVRREIQMAAFFNGEEPDFSPASARKAAERLVERTLIETEMEIGQYPAPEVSEVEPAFAEFKANRFSGEASYRGELAKYGLREVDVKRHVLWQLSLLRFIDARFGPGVQVLESEVREYYQDRLVRQWENRSSRKAPAFDEVRRDIEEILRADGEDRLLDSWLNEAKSRTRIEFKEEAFQ